MFYSIRRITGTIIIPMVIHAIWDFGSFTHVAGKATGVVDQVDLAAAGLSMVQQLLVLVAVILCIVGATRILGTKKHVAQHAQA